MSNNVLQWLLRNETKVTGARSRMGRFGLKFPATLVQINLLPAEPECLATSESDDFHA